ncbi:GntR family transcriptional regulator [Streptomyces sp. NPDC001817]|uniref:GntR family transcriptional regulator n=1 Tax=Streptomyces sp. NPDC001817 TaxID=3154398 RepID=UPI003326080F
MTGVSLKHQRISRILAPEIRDGSRRAGERLPGEHALAARFGVSRTSVRAALAEPSEEGLIATRTGKGSYVVLDGRPPGDRLGRARARAARGGDTAVRTLAVRETYEGALSAELGLDADGFVCGERIREPVADGTVVSYERRYPPPVPVIRGLPARGLGEEALTGVLLRAGLRPDHGGTAGLSTAGRRPGGGAAAARAGGLVPRDTADRPRGRRLLGSAQATGAGPPPDLPMILTHVPRPTGYARRSTPGAVPPRGGLYDRRYLGICHGDTRTQRPADARPASAGRVDRERRGPGRAGRPRPQ